MRASLLPTQRFEAEPVGAEVLVIDLAGLCPIMTVVVAYHPPESDSSLGKIIEAIDTVCVVPFCCWGTLICLSLCGKERIIIQSCSVGQLEQWRSVT